MWCITFWDKHKNQKIKRFHSEEEAEAYKDFLKDHGLQKSEILK